MIGDLKRYYRYMRLKAANGAMNEEPPAEKAPIPAGLAEVRNRLSESFGHSGDLILKPLNHSAMLLVYIDGMVDRKLLDDDVIRPLMQAFPKISKEQTGNLGFLKENLLTVGEVADIDDFNECVTAVLQGQVLLFASGSVTALCVYLPKWEKRSVEEPKTENVVRGPREGFTENIQDNIVMLRRKIRDGNLIFERMRIGRQTKTAVALCYLRGTANAEIVAEVRKRLRNIKTEKILESGQLEEFIEDAPLSIFSTVGHSERPDMVAGKLLDGRVAVLCDGTPFVLTAPNLFVEYLATAEDEYLRWVYSPLLRLFRFLSLFASISVPGFYVAFICFHQDVVPFRLLLTMTAASENTPFPPVAECVMLILIFELIREGGIRMPRSLGQTISIVGALIIGQAAVQAGVVSAPSLIVISATAICTFVVPQLDYPMLIMRLVLLFAANMIGFLGIVLSLMLIFAYLCSLKSFGVPYLSPLAPRCGQDLKQAFIRMPVWSFLRKSETVTRKYIDNARQGREGG